MLPTIDVTGRETYQRGEPRLGVVISESKVPVRRCAVLLLLSGLAEILVDISMILPL